MSDEFPSFVWDSSAQILFYYSDAYHFAEFHPAPSQLKIIQALSEDSLADTFLNWETHKELCEAIINCSSNTYILSVSLDCKVITRLL